MGTGAASPRITIAAACLTPNASQGLRDPKRTNPQEAPTMTDDETPNPPDGTGDSGRALWRSVVDRFDLDEHELALLREASRLVDLLDLLDAAVKRDGAMLGDRVHPAAVESRQSRLALARLLAALRLPDGVETATRPQRRGGARRPYRMTGDR